MVKSDRYKKCEEMEGNNMEYEKPNMRITVFSNNVIITSLIVKPGGGNEEEDDIVITAF